MTLPAGWEGPNQNFLGLDEPWCHPDQAGVYVLPAPYEHTSSYIRGSDRGPSAILEASSLVVDLRNATGALGKNNPHVVKL